MPHAYVGLRLRGATSIERFEIGQECVERQYQHDALNKRAA
jgi:hypothetical protein